MKPVKVKGKFKDWKNKSPDSVETTPKKEKKNFVTVTIVLKNGDTYQGKAKDFLYHAMDGEVTVDWIAALAPVAGIKDYDDNIPIADIENFMVSR